MLTWAGLERAKAIISAISSACNALYPLYTLSALSDPLKRTLENSVSTKPGLIAVTFIP